MCDLVLGEQGKLLVAVGVEEGHAVGIDLKAAVGVGHVVGDDESEALLVELAAGVGEDVLRFGREADAHDAGRHLREEVGVLQQAEVEGVGGALLLDLLVGDLCGAVVADGGGHDQDVGVVGGGEDGVAHLADGLDAVEGDADGVGQVRGRGHEGHACAAVAGGFGQGVAHLAGGAVGDDAHGVEGLPGAPGGDDDVAARQVAGAAQHPSDVVEERLGLDHAAWAYEAGGQAARRGADDVRAAPLERRQVLLEGGMLVHVGVHGGGEKQRRLGGQGRGGEGVVGEAEGELGDDVGRGRGDDQQVGAGGQGDVLHGELRLEVEEVRDHGPVGDAAEGHGRDELGGAAGEDDVDVRAGLHEAAGKLGGLVAGDAAGDSQDDVFVG